MSVRDDIGSLVCVLSDELIRQYDSDGPEEMREPIEIYFSGLGHLWRDRNDPSGFDDRLPSFKKSLESIAEPVHRAYLQRQFLCRNLLAFSGACVLATYAAGTAQLLTAGIDAAKDYFFVATAGLVGAGYILGKHQQARLVRKTLAEYPALAKAPCDSWRDAFINYRKDIRELVYAFSDAKPIRQKV